MHKLTDEFLKFLENDVMHDFPGLNATDQALRRQAAAMMLRTGVAYWIEWADHTVTVSRNGLVNTCFLAGFFGSVIVVS